jgi:nitrogen regulatory protein PII
MDYLSNQTYVATCRVYAHYMAANLVEETKDLASNVLPPGLLVVHDTGRGGENDETELTRGKELDDPLLEVTELDVVAGGDDTGLVELQIQSVPVKV